MTSLAEVEVWKSVLYARLIWCVARVKCVRETCRRCSSCCPSTRREQSVL